MAVTADYDAQTAVERELVLRLASLLWRLRRGKLTKSGKRLSMVCTEKPPPIYSALPPTIDRKFRARPIAMTRAHVDDGSEGRKVYDDVVIGVAQALDELQWRPTVLNIRCGFVQSRGIGVRIFF